MAFIYNTISYYRVGLVQADNIDEKIEINLYQSFGSTSNHIARLRFAESITTPQILWPATGTIAPVEVWYKLETYARIIDLLRNEKPLTLASNRSWNRVTIKSGNEPTGEEES